jgi:GNAT superfamily N-acetyltransferase
VTSTLIAPGVCHPDGVCVPAGRGAGAHGGHLIEVRLGGGGIFRVMVEAVALDDDAAAARDWHHGLHRAVCDRLTPWEAGTVVRASRYPNYFDYSAVRVEHDTPMGFAELEAFADRALDGLAHRRVDFELMAPAERVRADFDANGWKTMRLLWMLHRSPAPRPAPALVQPVDYDAVQRLRVAWHREDFDFPLTDGSYFVQSRELALRRGARVLAVLERGEPIAFAQLIRVRKAAEITHVYVSPEHRGRGLGTAITSAAIADAGAARNLWICADEEDRPKELYERLGFAPAWTTAQFLRVPR